MSGYNSSVRRLVLLLPVALISIAAQPSAQVTCSSIQECRELALAAQQRGDVEAFHDLAWRTVQTGARNDAALMFLLARAQSVSGRASDALVMLKRLADRGVDISEAETSDDFRRVRNLAAWAEWKGLPPPAPAAVSTPPAAAPAVAEASMKTAPPSSKSAPATTKPALADRQARDRSDIHGRGCKRAGGHGDTGCEGNGCEGTSPRRSDCRALAPACGERAERARLRRRLRPARAR